MSPRGPSKILDLAIFVRRKANCPDNPYRILIVTGDVDELDSYAETDSAYISNFILCDTMAAVIFSPTETVLDNAAGLDVFINYEPKFAVQSNFFTC